MVNVVCMKWGAKYGPEYVNRLYSMVKRHLQLEFRFACFTDDGSGLDSGIEVFPLPPIHVPEAHDISPWRKVALLNPELGDLTGKTLFLDLDVIIVDDIDCFFEFSDKFTIIENWTQLGQGIGNSSVYLFEVGAHSDVALKYEREIDTVFSEYSNEQIFISKNIPDKHYWPKDWCRSFKFHAIPRGLMRYLKEPSIPEGCKILVFHGYPNPDQALAGDYGTKLRKYFKPARWITDYWC